MARVDLRFLISILFRGVAFFHLFNEVKKIIPKISFFSLPYLRISLHTTSSQDVRLSRPNICSYLVDSTLHPISLFTD